MQRPDLPGSGLRRVLPLHELRQAVHRAVSRCRLTGPRITLQEHRPEVPGHHFCIRPIPPTWMPVEVRVSQRFDRCGAPGRRYEGGMALGLLKFLFGQDNRSKAQRDQWRPSVVGKNLISPINSYGTCFGCQGTGRRTLDCRACSSTGWHSGSCRACDGSGRHERPAKECFGCDGSGSKRGKPCHRCNGSGVFQAAVSETCRKCNGSGRYQMTCRKCSGAGRFTVRCKKCGGSGWHKF
jgi:DnaJ-class molecular chaperone